MSGRYYSELHPRWGIVIRDREQKRTSYAVARGEKPRVTDAIVASYVDTRIVDRIVDGLNQEEDE